MTAASDQPVPNAFETAVLQAMARERPSMNFDVQRLRVRNRTYTGVGSFTDFVCDDAGEPRTVRLEAPIVVPGVPHGMGAVLYCRGERPSCLETFTHGEHAWSGDSEGFSFG